MIDAQSAAEKGDITTFIPTYTNIADLAQNEMPDIAPEIINEVMSAEYSKTYEVLHSTAKQDGYDLGDPEQSLGFAQKHGLTEDDTQRLLVRHRINKTYGANEHFLGNGLTKDINSADGLGTIETFSLDKKPDTLSNLEQMGVISRIQLTSY